MAEDSPASPRFFGGRLLLAMPGIGDPRFEHSAIAICVHDENGALGLDLSHRLGGMGLHDLFASLAIEVAAVPDRGVLRGGPVEPQRGFVLHTREWVGQDSAEVGEKWSLSGSVDVLRAIGGDGGPSRYLVALGYVGWGAGQLESEMVRHGWFLGPALSDEMFLRAAEQRWSAAFADCGVDTRMLAPRSGQA